MLKLNSAYFNFFTHAADVLLVFSCVLLSYRLNILPSFELSKILAIYSSLMVAVIFPVFGLYRSRRGESLIDEIGTVLVAWAIVLILFNSLLLLLANNEQFKVLWPVGLFKIKGIWIWAGLSVSAIIGFRISLRLFLRFMRKHGYNQRHAVVVGAGLVGKRVAEHLHLNSSTGIQVIGFFDDAIEKNAAVEVCSNHRIAVMGSICDCIEYSLHHKPDIVFIALPMRAGKKINELVWQLGLKGICVMMVPDVFAFGLQKARLIQLGDIPVMVFNLFPRWKRVFDIIFSTIVLILLAPMMLIIGAVIKWEDAGPVFYRHTRIGESGKRFGCLKFRTMHVDADKRLNEILEDNPALMKEWKETYKLKKDPRITRIGRFLRKSSLDELPQFINVLKGDMSVVGARPIVLDELETHYNSIALTYCAMKPGLTGLWQVGKRSDVECYDERVKQDRWYILNASPWVDSKIIIKTVYKVLLGKGAY